MATGASAMSAAAGWQDYDSQQNAGWQDYQPTAKPAPLPNTGLAPAAGAPPKMLDSGEGPIARNLTSFENQISTIPKSAVQMLGAKHWPVIDSKNWNELGQDVKSLNPVMHEYEGGPVDWGATAANFAPLALDVGGRGIGESPLGKVTKRIASAPEAATKAGSAIRATAIGDQNVPALRGLGVPSSSRQSLRTLGNVETARPYLRGVKSEAGLQERIPQAKAEIWKPYKDVIDSPVGDRTVQGPDGPTTIRELEAARLKSAADLRSTRQMQPADQAALERKQGTIAELMERDRAIKAVLDPELEKAGLNPQLIRNVHGSVQGIDKLVSGKSTLAETEKPYGFGHLKDFDIAKPMEWPSIFLKSGRDLAAGRPWLSGKPTDVNISEGFRNAEPKPTLTRPIPPIEGEYTEE